MGILVCPLSRVSHMVKTHQPHRVVSVLDPGFQFPELGMPYMNRHLRLAFHDVHEPAPGVTTPSSQHIAQLVEFLDSWSAHEVLLVHCRAGIGRSTATAFIAACHRNPLASEMEIAIALRRVAPLARPNEALVALADTVMNRGGRMSAAIAETGRGLGWINVAEGEPFELSDRFDQPISRFTPPT